MKKDLFKTIVSFLAALLMISVLTFLLAKLSSADQAENYLRISKIQVNPQSLEKAREYLGLNQPWPQQYLGWLTKALRGDFGTSYLLKGSCPSPGAGAFPVDSFSRFDFLCSHFAYVHSFGDF